MLESVRWDSGPELDAVDYKNHNLAERRYSHIKQWRGLAPL